VKPGSGAHGDGAIDSTRVKANASVDRVEQARQERARERRRCVAGRRSDADDGNAGAGTSVRGLRRAAGRMEVPAQLPSLLKIEKRSWMDPDSRFLRQRGGRFVLGYTGEIAVSEDHLIGKTSAARGWIPT
jgi:hypothetical protein